MNLINLLIHCDLEAVPVKQMPREPAVAQVIASAGQGTDVVFQSPPCHGHSRPALVVLDELPEEFFGWGPRQ